MRWLFVLAALLVLAAGGVYVAALHSLESRGLRERLANELAGMFGGTATISALRWDGSSILCSALLTRSEPTAEIRAARVAMPLSPAALWRNDWKIDKLTIANAQIAFGAATAPRTVATPPASGSELREVEIDRADVLYGDAGEWRDSHVKLFRQDAALIVQADRGVFRYANFPPLALMTCQLTYAKPNLHVDRASFTAGDNSSIDVTGDVTFDQQNLIHAAGAILVANALLKNIAVLARVAAFTGRSELAHAKIDNAKADFDWNGQTLTVKNFAAEARQLFGVRGEFVVEDGKLNGEFEFGVAPDVVEKFPGAREDIFRPGSDAYMWTPVSVSGRVHDLRDNLRPRLLRAALEHHADEKIIEAIAEL